MQLNIRKAAVRWIAGPRGGRRIVTTESGALAERPVSLGRAPSRNSATNSAELIAAAHACSFSLALAAELGATALRTGEILISAAVTLQPLATGWTITNIHLGVIARLPHLSQGDFIDATVRAKLNCLVSRALRPSVSMNAKLEKEPPGPLGRTSCTKIPTTRRRARGRQTRNP